MYLMRATGSRTLNLSMLLQVGASKITQAF